MLFLRLRACKSSHYEMMDVIMRTDKGFSVIGCLNLIYRLFARSQRQDSHCNPLGLLGYYNYITTVIAIIQQCLIYQFTEQEIDLLYHF